MIMFWQNVFKGRDEKGGEQSDETKRVLSRIF